MRTVFIPIFCPMGLIDLTHRKGRGERSVGSSVWKRMCSHHITIFDHRPVHETPRQKLAINIASQTKYEQRFQYECSSSSQGPERQKNQISRRIAVFSIRSCQRPAPHHESNLHFRALVPCTHYPNPRNARTSVQIQTQRHKSTRRLSEGQELQEDALRTFSEMWQEDDLLR